MKRSRAAIFAWRWMSARFDLLFEITAITELHDYSQLT